MKNNSIVYTLLLVLAFVGTSCSKSASLQKQKELGLKVRDQILSDPNKFPVLDEQKYPDAYAHIRRITQNVLNSGKVIHKDDFAWEVYIINDDATLNAFCTPGGYIFVYTGLIKYLDTEDQLAGVMGHEIAHADLEHSMRQYKKQMGTSVIASVAGALIFKDASIGREVAGLAVGIMSLTYSRGHETEADMQSVEYLSGTSYQCSGASGFFEKLQAEKSERPPAFLSTHPDPGNRVIRIKNKAKRLNCNTVPQNNVQYKAFQHSLPQ